MQYLHAVVFAEHLSRIVSESSKSMRCEPSDPSQVLPIIIRALFDSSSQLQDCRFGDDFTIVDTAQSPHWNVFICWHVGKQQDLCTKALQLLKKQLSLGIEAGETV